MTSECTNTTTGATVVVVTTACDCGGPSASGVCSYGTRCEKEVRCPPVPGAICRRHDPASCDPVPAQVCGHRHPKNISSVALEACTTAAANCADKTRTGGVAASTPTSNTTRAQPPVLGAPGTPGAGTSSTTAAPGPGTGRGGGSSSGSGTTVALVCVGVLLAALCGAAAVFLWHQHHQHQRTHRAAVRQMRTMSTRRARPDEVVANAAFAGDAGSGSAALERDEDYVGDVGDVGEAAVPQYAVPLTTAGHGGEPGGGGDYVVVEQSAGARDLGRVVEHVGEGRGGAMPQYAVPLTTADYSHAAAADYVEVGSSHAYETMGADSNA